MAKFKVHHLKDDINKGFFLKPRPRFDQTIADAYCITREQLTQIETEKVEQEIEPDTYMKGIAHRCKEVWDESGYEHVADVNSKDIVQALRNTNNINGHWFLTTPKGVSVVKDDVSRATRTGDVIEVLDSEEMYMVYSYTFLNISTGEILD
jgi:hypothetical protein